MIHRFSATRRGRGDYSRRRDMNSYSVQCDRTGFRAQASDCVMEWNGHFVIKKYMEQQNIQEFIQVPRDDIAVPIARPRDTSNTIDQTLAPDPDSF